MIGSLHAVPYLLAPHVVIRHQAAIKPLLISLDNPAKYRIHVIVQVSQSSQEELHKQTKESGRLKPIAEKPNLGSIEIKWARYDEAIS